MEENRPPPRPAHGNSRGWASTGVMELAGVLCLCFRVSAVPFDALGFVFIHLFISVG